MKKKLLSLFLSLAMALSLAACGADELVSILVMSNAGDSVGVIGGADGPTSILVTDGEGSQQWLDQDDAGSTGTGEAGGGDLELFTAPSADPPADSPTAGEEWYEEPIDEDGTYNSAEDVGLYLHTYGHLPDNYITKSEARQLGWEGGSVERWAGEGYAIGGSKFGNNEGLLPKADGRQYYECDIDTVGRSSRGAKRIVYSNDGLIYYTDDHYESFTLLYGEAEG